MAANNHSESCGVTVSTTTASLSRAFGIVMRQIADLLTMLQDYHVLAPTLPRILSVSYQESINLQVGDIIFECINHG